MISIDDIRNVFSKGSIAINHAGITVFYQNKEGWVSQEIIDGSLSVFAEILEGSDCMIIQCIAQEMIKIAFRKELTGQEVVFYSPIKEELSIGELRKIIENVDDSGNGARGEFFDFFIGTDLDDGDAVLAKLREFVESKSRKTNIISLPAHIRWRELRKSVSAFADTFGFDAECTEPNCDTNGYIEVFYPEKYDKPIKIAGKTKEYLLNSLRACTLLSIECDVADGFLNMVFYN